jgi:hypothetical protein
MDFIAIDHSVPDHHKQQRFATLVEAEDHVGANPVLMPQGFATKHPGGASKYWTVDHAAKTVVNDQAQADADVLASSWDKLRRERNALLVSSDWTQASDSPLIDEVQATWATYRGELRDLPASTEDPADPSWPEAPE